MDILAPPYGKMLVLGALSAASAFVVTILIVLVCGGCYRRRKIKHSHGSVGTQRRGKGVLRQSKLSSISKSDTHLYEMQHLTCNVNGAPNNRPASMDLLLLQNHCSTSDLHLPTSSCQLLHNPTGPENENSDHLDPEDDGLYERVGVWRGPPAAPFQNSVESKAFAENGQSAEGAQPVEVRGLDEKVQTKVMAEYASVRKVRKIKIKRSEEESAEENTSSSNTVHINTVMHLHNPKISDTYSTVCKPIKKEHLVTAQQISGQTEEKGSNGPVLRPSGEEFYEELGEKTWSKMLRSDPAYASIKPMRQREMPCNSTLKPEMSSCENLQGPETAKTSENFYESIEDVKKGTTTTTTTTTDIFTLMTS